MMPIINIHPLPSEEKAESYRLTLKDADKFGLYCCTDGTNAMWSVIPKIALDLIFNAETDLPVAKHTSPSRNEVLEEVAKEFDKMPFGDTGASISAFIRGMMR